eukprot:363353-Chlamydomonas_euryale.AAC.7
MDVRLDERFVTNNVGMPPRIFLKRMLNNLKQIYTTTRDLERSLRVIRCALCCVGRRPALLSCMLAAWCWLPGVASPRAVCAPCSKPTWNHRMLYMRLTDPESAEEIRDEVGWACACACSGACCSVWYGAVGRALMGRWRGDALDTIMF